MNPCPISLEHLFLLIGAFEGLSLWGVLNQFSQDVRRSAYNRWKQVWVELGLLIGEKKTVFKLRILVIINSFFPFFALIARLLKWTPTVVISIALVVYSAYPVFMNQSASVEFYNHWEKFCGLIAIFALLQLFLFCCTWFYFLLFELVYKKMAEVSIVDPSPNDFDIV